MTDQQLRPPAGRDDAPAAHPPPPGPRTRSRPRLSAEAVALVVASALLAAAFLAEPLGAWGGHVHQWLPPLSAHFDPALGIGTPLALAVAVAVVARGPALARSLPWGRLLALTWAAGAAWGLGLALVRGWAGGVVAPLANEDEYLVDVPRVDDVLEVVRVYTDRILLTSPDHWTTHNSGHPPLPLILYTGLDRVGLGGPAASGLVTALVGSTAALAVLVTLRALGDERRARAAAPFLALAPMAIWVWISADGAFMAVTAWGLALLALAAASPRGRRGLLLALAGGLVLGTALFLSYGLILMAPLAVAVLVAARSWRPLLPAVLAALVPVVAFAAAGFWWVEAEQVLVERYYQGKGRLRQYSYWTWGNLAVTAFVLGPAVVAGTGAAVAGLRQGARGRPWHGRARGLLDRLALPPAGWLAVGAAVAILAATLSGLSKSEVERIWLPFTVWLVPLTAWLGAGRARAWLAAGAGWALAVSVVFRTTW